MAVEAYTANSALLPFIPEDGEYLSSSLYFRGDMAPKDVMSAIGLLKTKRTINFSKYIYGGMRCGIQYAPVRYLDSSMEVVFLPRSVTVLSNHTGMGHVLAKITHDYGVLCSPENYDNDLFKYSEELLGEYAALCPQKEDEADDNPDY
jgi:tubulin alpha